MLCQPAAKLFLLLVASSAITAPATAGQAVSFLRVRQDVAGPGRAMDHQLYEVFKQTQATLVTSPFVLNAALQDLAKQHPDLLEAEEQPLEWLQQRLQVEYPGKSEIMRVSMSGDAKKSVTVLKAVVNTYLREVVQAERAEILNRLEFFRDKQKEDQRRLREITDKCHALQAELGSPGSERSEIADKLRLQSLVAAQERLDWLRQRKLEAEIKQQVLAGRGEDANDDKKATQELEVRNRVLDQQIETHQQQIADRLKELDVAQARSSDLEMLRIERDGLEASVQATSAEIERVTLRVDEPSAITLVQPAIYLK